jgi:hypothetical protein
MPDVLEYASPAAGKRRRWHGDFDLAFLSFFQMCSWIWRATQPFYAPPVPGNQWSLFAFAWRCDQWFPLATIVLGIFTSLVVGITAFQPREKRASWYRKYLALIILFPLAHFPAHAYLVSQLPGVWGSLLLHQEYRDVPDCGAMYCLQPVVWLLLIRAMVPGRFVGGGEFSLVVSKSP